MRWRRGRTIASSVFMLNALIALSGTAPASGAAATWEPVAVPSAPGGSLWAISCTPTQQCMAVGESAQTGFAVVDDGSGWVTANRGLTSLPHLVLRAVDCPARNDCQAVGTIRPRDHTLVAVHWNGTTWKQESMTTPVGAGGPNDFAAMTCTSPHACLAVGLLYLGHNGVGVEGLVERFNGVRWQRLLLPQSFPRPWVIAGVSCITLHFCMLTGARPLGPWAVIWREGSWTLTRPRGVNPNSGVELGPVSCRSASWCMAIGGATTCPHTLSLDAEIWNGTNWRLVNPATPNCRSNPVFSDVTCAGTTSCVAAGYTGTDSHDLQGLVERWNGDRWVVVPSQNSAAFSSTELESVVCTPARHRCIAVGLATSGANTGGTWIEENSREAPHLLDRELGHGVLGHPAAATSGTTTA